MVVERIRRATRQNLRGMIPPCVDLFAGDLSTKTHLRHSDIRSGRLLKSRGRVLSLLPKSRQREPNKENFAAAAGRLNPLLVRGNQKTRGFRKGRKRIKAVASIQ